jgi:hypothetical protein
MDGLNGIFKDFDLATDTINVRKMVEFVQGGKKTSAEPDPLKPLATFFDENCKQIQELEPLFDLHILHTAISGRRLAFPRVTEYRRICLAWTRPDEHESIMNNLQTRLAAKTKSKLASFLKLKTSSS